MPNFTKDEMTEKEDQLLSEYVSYVELLMYATDFLFATRHDFIARHPKYYLPKISGYISELTEISNNIIELQSEKERREN